MGPAAGANERHRADRRAHQFSRVLWEKPEAEAKAVAKVPMGRIGEADDVAGLALLLASPAGSFINGQTIGVDGGASAW